MVDLFRTIALTIILALIAVAGHAITASEVKTKEDLKQFVGEAVDAYYIDYVIRERCDLSELGPLPIDLETDSTEEIKRGVHLLETTGVNIAELCDFENALEFRQVFHNDPRWRSGSIYLFVSINFTTPYNGLVPEFVGVDDLEDITDVAGRLVSQMIADAAMGPLPGQTEKGFLEYCWDDPAVEGDEIVDDDILTSPGDSWKIGYAVEVLEHLGFNEPDGWPGILLISGIYPKTGTPPEGCRIVLAEEEDDNGGCSLGKAEGNVSSSILILAAAITLLFVIGKKLYFRREN